ncbi:MliC family protein [Devosia sp. MC521]|nr:MULTISPECIES: MliC family protein [unclassified Devosia]MBJ6986663.1 MliC family protein [Devosia sp. MC521]MBK1793801.1 MliC family protein [Devosia sp. WQ 349K1]QMW61699.1 MliC family protein [Devosia sp. MC521]
MTVIRIISAIGLILASTGAVLSQDAVAPEEVPAATAPALNTAGVSLTISIDTAGDIDRKMVSYACENGVTLPVQYINAAPNFLAIVPVDGANLVMVTTLSGSGARYVAGPYEWWSTGDDATLRDLMQDEDSDPLLSCTAVVNTP